MESVETLVVGAGPVGLFLAGELVRRGRTCTVVECEAQQSAHSKALAIMPGTMELFESAGIASRFAAHANRIDGVRFVTPRAEVFVPFGGIRSRYNYVSILPQWKTEQLLAERLRELGGEVRYGHALTQLRAAEGGCVATLETPGGMHRVSARYVAGCDGIYSSVRAQSGIAFEGGTYPGTALLADAAVRSAVPANEARVHVYEDGVVTMFPMSAQLRRFVVIAPLEQLPERAEPEWLERRLQRAGLRETAVEQIVWSNAFRVHRRVASRMRRGNVFLAGDSVHTHSPVGGQGMNIGLHDAASLAGVLARVSCGEAPEALLDSYERERLPVARRVLRTTDLLTRALADPHPLARLTRERVAPRLARMPAVYVPLIRALSLTGQRVTV